MQQLSVLTPIKVHGSGTIAKRLSEDSIENMAMQSKYKVAASMLRDLDATTLYLDCLSLSLCVTHTLFSRHSTMSVLLLMYSTSES